MAAMPAMGMAAMHAQGTAEDQGNGTYAANIELPSGGTWSLTITASKGGHTDRTQTGGRVSQRLHGDVRKEL